MTRTLTRRTLIGGAAIALVPPRIARAQPPRPLIVSERDAQSVIDALRLSTIIDEHLEEIRNNPCKNDRTLKALIIAYDEALKTIKDDDIRIVLNSKYLTVDIPECKSV